MIEASTWILTNAGGLLDIPYPIEVFYRSIILISIRIIGRKSILLSNNYVEQFYEFGRVMHEPRTYLEQS